MRNYVILAGTAAALSACGGAGPETIGSTAPAGTVGPGSGTNAATDIYAQFANPVDAKSYKGVGGTQRLTYTTDNRVTQGQQGLTYSANASTVRDSAIDIAYDPRDAIFTLTIADAKSGAGTTVRFQDPAQRTNFGGTTEPQWGTPNLAQLPAGAAANRNVNYLQSGGGNPTSLYGQSGTGFVDPGNSTTPPDGMPGSSYTAYSFFYEKPGSTTKYVSFAGYVANTVSFANVMAGTETLTQDSWTLERGAFAYGALTNNSAVPTSGSASYTGSMLGTMVFNPTLDDSVKKSTYFQWLTGTSTLSVNFASKQVGLAVDGFVLDPQYDRYTTPSITVPGGATFSGSGSALIDLVGKGGFTGTFQSFAFKNGATTLPVAVAGSSIDGAFYGPAAEEAGGGFRVVGGVPDQRVDIVGAFTGKK
ncbi:transferrin-binding protein-like solute binding protein [Sphingomonas aracearum]|uniref:Transferrin-binding protein B C-lobe/N-lobe beta-barrel domain-containing protein n=1 Tax=Sphingomonas aracearum TaxID=2283317 RepID=A0A369W0M1_9SPHN|nr:transferrin-binding protein-like solute binding protein [Sphingomonas aracearum]RDE05631.1 hypothetical protein DVW87_10425 [Sphingomonas aracearum]